MSNTRSVACLLGHVDHGKSSLISRLGFKLNHEHKITSRIYVYGTKSWSLIDTPGHAHLYLDREVAICASHFAMLVIDINDRISEIVINFIKNHHEKSFIIVWSKVDISPEPEAQIDEIMNHLRTIEGWEESRLMGTINGHHIEKIKSIMSAESLFHNESYIGCLVGLVNCKGLGWGCEFIPYYKDGSIPHEIYLGNEKFRIIKSTIKKRKDLTPFGNCDECLFMKLDRLPSHNYIGMRACKTPIKEEEMPLGSLIKTNPAEYNLAIVAQSWSNVGAIYDKIIAASSLTGINYGIIWFGVGELPNHVKSNVREFNCKILDFTKKDMADFQTDIFEIFSKRVISHALPDCEIKILKHFRNVKINTKKVTIIGGRLLFGQIETGCGIIAENKEVIKIESVGIKGNPVESASEGSEVGLMLEKTYLPDIASIVKCLSRQNYLKIKDKISLIRNLLHCD